MKKLSLALMTLLTMTLASCNNQNNNDGEEIVRLWCQPFTEVETRTWLSEKIDEFNESEIAIENKFKVELTFVSEDAWEQTLKAAQSSHTAPEITVLNYAEVALNSVEGYYTALDEYMSKECFADLLDNVEKLTNVSGKHYIYPWFVEPYSILFYRKSAFSKAGLDPNVAPSSWDELYQYAKKLTVDKTYGIAMPNSSQLGWVLWGFLAQDNSSQGYYLLDNDWSKAKVNTPFHQSLFTLFKNMYDEKLTPKVALSSYNEITPLAENYVAMDLGGSWSIGQIKNNYPDILDDIGYAVCPTIDGKNEKQTTAALGGWGMAIDGNAAHPSECGKFIEWLLGSGTTNLTTYMKNLGYSKFAARKSIEEALANDESAQNDPFYKFVSKEVLPYAKAEPVYIWEISRKYADALETVTQLNKEINSTLSQLENELNDLIEAECLSGTNPFNQK